MTSTSSQAGYPVRLTGELDPNLSRWLWLVKMFLAIPHYVVLAFLWIAFLVTTMIAGFAILVTGRYPRSLFDFNVGVLRWNWRVGFYVYAALGTDRYPPFTLARADYPADLEVAYPEHPSRGLVLVKWLLAVPHLMIVGLIAAPILPWWWTEHRLDRRHPAHRRLLNAQPARRPRRLLPVDHPAVPAHPLRPARGHQPLALPGPHLCRPACATSTRRSASTKVPTSPIHRVHLSACKITMPTSPAATSQRRPGRDDRNRPTRRCQITNRAGAHSHRSPLLVSGFAAELTSADPAGRGRGPRLASAGPSDLGQPHRGKLLAATRRRDVGGSHGV